MARLPRSAKLKLTWLLTALVVVWISGPAGGAAGIAAGPAAGLENASAVGRGAWLEVGLGRGRVTEQAGVRLGVLAVVDEAVYPASGAVEGERLISVYVALKNVGEGCVAYTALDLELRGDDGRWSSLGARRGPGPMLTFGTLSSGQAVSGWRMFRVPAGAGPFTLAYSLRPGS